MNKVFISGRIANTPSFFQTEGGKSHLALLLSVRHKNVKGTVKHALYKVNAWNSAAVWGRDNLHKGQEVIVQGHLTQRLSVDGRTFVEITAEEFLRGRNRQAVPQCVPDAAPGDFGKCAFESTHMESAGMDAAFQ